MSFIYPSFSLKHIQPMAFTLYIFSLQFPSDQSHSLYIFSSNSRVTNRIRFLKVVENKLSKSFLGTKYYNKAKDFNRVVTFKIPSSEGYTRDTVQPPDLLELASLEASEDCWAELLVATTHLTEPGNRKKTAVLRRWADRDPEAKEVWSIIRVGGVMWVWCN